MKRVAIGTGVYVAVMFMTGALIDAFPITTELLVFKILAPFSLFFNPLTVRAWLFDLEGGGGQMPLASVGLPEWVAAVSILVVAAVTVVLALRRYRTEI